MFEIKLYQSLVVLALFWTLEPSQFFCLSFNKQHFVVNFYDKIWLIFFYWFVENHNIICCGLESAQYLRRFCLWIRVKTYFGEERFFIVYKQVSFLCLLLRRRDFQNLVFENYWYIWSFFWGRYLKVFWYSCLIFYLYCLFIVE